MGSVLNASVHNWRALIPLLFLPALFVCLLSLSPRAQAAAKDYFRITVVDADTGRGVPLVALTTVNALTFYTDSNGIVALNEPELVGQTVWFSVKSHGYEFPADGFGYRGVALKVQLGRSAQVKIKRLNIADRLYRLTGAGIYRDSVLVGQPVPLPHPLLDGLVMGQDTVVASPYKGRIYWFFGDTERPGYPLGQFATSGATSLLPGRGGLNPSLGVDLTYWIDKDGFSRPMLPLSGFGGPVWVGGVFTLKDVQGREHLYTHYDHLNGQGKVAEQGLAVFNDAKAQFEPIAKYAGDEPLHPAGQPFHTNVNGQPYLYFAPVTQEAYPLVRVRADIAQITNPHAYEAYSCLLPGSRDQGADTPLEWTPDGKLVYGWKTDTPALGEDTQRALIAKGKMKPDEVLTPLRDVDTDAPVRSHGGSVYWNAYRKRWIMITGQSFGTPSFLGELWFAEADTPVGPWVYAKKIITHDHYTFYNPTQHPFFDQDGGRLIYLEGTYTDTYSGNPDLTPRYNYNQIMYRLALDDPRLSLPVPVYRLKRPDGILAYGLRETVDAKQEWRQVQSIPFYAIPPSRRPNGLVPVLSSDGSLLCYVLPPTPAASEKPSQALMPLYQYRDAQTGGVSYSTDPNAQTATVTRVIEPIGRVWRNPSTILALDEAAKPTP